MSAGNKDGFDFRQAFTFHKKRHMSMIVAVALLIAFIVVKSGVSWELSNRVERDSPSLALNTLITDLRQYRTLKREFPNSFEQLNNEIWAKNDRPVNLIGKRYFSQANYVYYYSAGDGFCSVWAVPQGNYKESAETVFVLLNGTNQEVWRGRALSDEQKKNIPSVVRPPTALMAQFNMSRDATESKSEKTDKSGSTFPSFNFFQK